MIGSEDVVEDVDLLVVGGGKAGKTLAMDTARAGRRVVMVERGMIGGTCINVACIPTKALVTSARLARRVATAESLGLNLGKLEVDLRLLRSHKEGVVSEMVDLNHRQFLDSGMDLVLGEARFVAERTVEIRLNEGGRRVVRGGDVVINTGTVPHVPAVPGLAEAGALSSETIQQLDRIPERLVVLGGGYVGLEFAQMFTAFGSRVTVLDRNLTLLPQEDPDITEVLAEYLREDGVEMLGGVSVKEVVRETDGVRVFLEDGRSLVADDILAATGRDPVTAGLGLDAAGVRTDERGFIRVDDRLATDAPHTWAVGDVAGGPQFTHVSLDDYRVVKENIAGGSRSTADRLVPWNLFTDPELARVGLTEAQARATGRNVRVARLPVKAIPRSRTLRDTRGVWKAVVDRDTDEILGVALLGPESSEVLTVVQTAMWAGLPFTALRDGLIAHPTMAEGLNALFTAWTD
ncbi:dihydrolipoyl dehydrogenase family protein [Streptomyces griseoviridis]|uniref:Pyruvate/2-oxoglutarate dehydrogenase complex dihydrolipoamide dehydrogenase (E3) component n=1 Tax=Streptomyces griseoviridis TaxID=45398 RepID=A0ABT9LBY6_STRGD|nr:FAD-dependent oxidoreductase [Streptomyces griseoviridis]MDP9680272.1 pyruvate/2-oxoglutarate dehydrogenase complex dihydrolipoamide dehydrogenase (E3) component [Streptomyces griseoviridis]GGT24912.1 pyridine nucleotide-disulfide oxidoreductase [Streptomyces griseoviridis]